MQQNKVRLLSKNMGLSEEEWRIAATTTTSSQETALSSEMRDQYLRFLDYSPETKRALETIEMDTNMSTSSTAKQYFKTDKEGNCKLSIQKQFLQRIE